MKYLLTIVLLFSSNQASAIFLTGNELLPKCEEFVTKTDHYFDSAICQAYIIGITDASITFVNWNNMEKDMCLPDNVGSRKLVRVVIKYLQEHPEDLHLSASSLVLNAFIKAFPCE